MAHDREDLVGRPRPELGSERRELVGEIGDSGRVAARLGETGAQPCQYALAGVAAQVLARFLEQDAIVALD